jgi:hypothetical protein
LHKSLLLVRQGKFTDFFSKPGRSTRQSSEVEYAGYLSAAAKEKVRSEKTEEFRRVGLLIRPAATLTHEV